MPHASAAATEPLDTSRRPAAAFAAVGGALIAPRTDLWSVFRARELWVEEARTVPWPELVARRARQPRSARGSSVLLLTCDYEKEAQLAREAENRVRALAKASEPPPRRDVYVKGAQVTGAT